MYYSTIRSLSSRAPTGSYLSLLALQAYHVVIQLLRIIFYNKICFKMCIQSIGSYMYVPCCADGMLINIRGPEGNE